LGLCAETDCISKNVNSRTIDILFILLFKNNGKGTNELRTENGMWEKTDSSCCRVQCQIQEMRD
jgi:hypothetical protein